MILDSWGKRLLAFTLPVVVALFYITASAHFRYTPDDTYIYLQYARNLTNGQGISFNAGEPSYGITSPLWLFIISLGGKLGVDFATAAKGMDLLFASLSLLIFYSVAHEIIRDLAVALSATMAFSVNAWLLRWAGTGMETSFSVFVALLAIRSCLRNEYFMATAMAALLFLVRPESFLLMGLIAADIYHNSFDKRRAVRVAGGMIVLYVAFILPWLIYAFITFGTIVPNTALAKAGLNFSPADAMATVTDIASTIMVSDGAAVLVLLAAGIALLLQLRARTGADTEPPGERFYVLRQTLIGLGWALLIVLFYVGTQVNVVSRYLLIITPFVVIYAFFYLHRSLALSRFRRYAYLAVFGFTGLMMLQQQFFYRNYVLPGIMVFERGMETCLIPIGRWCGEHTPPDAVIFGQDIGALGYFSQRKVCDGSGLVSRDLLALRRLGYSHERMMEEKLYSKQCAATFVIDRAFAPEALKGQPDLEPLMTRAFVGMGLAETRVSYYTLYKVIQTPAATVP